MNGTVSQKGFGQANVLAIIKNNPKFFDSCSSATDAQQVANVIQFLKVFVEYRAKKVSTSQIRNLYAKCREVSNDAELQLIRPYIAYTLARQQRQSDDVKEFFYFLDDLIKAGISYRSFQKIFEAIVAYHKCYGQNN